jgi:predicted O-methyltransferase YrrM
MSIETGTNRQAVADLATEVGARTIVEIGVRRGRLSLLLAEVPTLVNLYLIDTWEPEEATTQNQHKNARSVKRWAKKNNKITVLHMPSAEAASKFRYGQIDFVYIDGDHSVEGVKADIKSYLPKVSHNGIISGDDYNLLEVRTAVRTLLPRHVVHTNGRFWWSHK